VNRILNFLRLPPSDQWLFIRSALLLVVISCGLYVLPFKTLLALLSKLKEKPMGRRNSNRLSADRIAWSVKSAGRHIPLTTCLSRALVGRMVFGREGYPCDLHIGVAKSEANRLEAHAWLEMGGRIVAGNCHDLSRYHILKSWKAEGV
jgi:hypothetical protein